MSISAKKLVLHFAIDSSVLVNPDETISIEERVNTWLAHKRIGNADANNEWTAVIDIRNEEPDNQNSSEFTSYA